MKKNEPKKFQHTKGEWKYVEGINGDYIRTDEDTRKGSYIASLRADDGSCYDGLTSEETRANGRRIVKCVNMHDELVAQIKKDVADLQYIGEGNLTNYEIRKLERLSNLLKKAEQE